MARVRFGWVAAGVLGLGGAFALVGSYSGTRPALPTANLSATERAAAISPAAADQVATSYATSHFAGPGTAQVLKTEPDVDRGVAVYDVRTLAPNGAIYVIQVARSDGSVLSSSLAESQPVSTTTSTTSTTESTTTTVPPTSTPVLEPSTSRSEQVSSSPEPTEVTRTEPTEPPHTETTDKPETPDTTETTDKPETQATTESSGNSGDSSQPQSSTSTTSSGS